MQKDVIYIDVEDDITAIIGKVKDAKHKVVALVPPKRTGVLQSAVNLRLLSRTADTANKHLVLITSNPALTGLAASAKIPVAKNLQSKPELAPIAALQVDDDDIIDGENLPVGDHAKTRTEIPVSGMVPPSKVENLDIDGEVAKSTDSPRKAPAKKGIKVPDFGTFRKKIFILGGLGVLLIAFLIWAIWFAPRATVVISAKTSDLELSVPVSLGASVTTDSDQAHLQSIDQKEKATQSVEFDATGSKEVGEKAVGTVTFATQSIGDLGTSIPAGTVLTAANGLVYTTAQAVTISISNYQGATAGITAAGSGTKYNGASGPVSGAPGSVSAKITDTTTGGTDKTIKIVQQSDIDKAKAQLAEQNADEMKKKLKEKFGAEVIVIDSSFKASGTDPQSSPAVGQEATAKAKLTQETTYTMVGVAKSQLNDYLGSAFEKMLTDKDEQKIYDNGASSVKFADFAHPDGDQAGSANLSAVAQVGPRIDDSEIKDLVKGKRYGEIEGDLKAIEGVSDVEVNLSPFWVQGVPGDVNKITIEFKLLKSNG